MIDRRDSNLRVKYISSSLWSHLEEYLVLVINSYSTMATRAANKRVALSYPILPPLYEQLTNKSSQLTREYQTIQQNPPPYIIAHPSESNILEFVLLSLPPRSNSLQLNPSPSNADGTTSLLALPKHLTKMVNTGEPSSFLPTTPSPRPPSACTPLPAAFNRQPVSASQYLTSTLNRSTQPGKSPPSSSGSCLL